MKNRVSLVVLNYNGLHHLEEYFTSVFSQSRVPDQVIMLDNNSTDTSREYVKKSFPQVTVVHNKTNEATAGGSNRGFEHAVGDYVIFQSNDLRLDKNCIKRLVDVMEENPLIGICTSVFIKYDVANKGIREVDNAGGIEDVYGFGMQKYPNELLVNIPQQEEVFFSYGSSFIVRRDIYKRVGGFDERYFTLNDDIDLSWRIRLLGLRVVYDKRSFVYHKGSATLGTLFQRSRKRYWSERNACATLLKDASVLHLIRYLPFYFILLFAEIGYMMYRRKYTMSFAIVKAIAWNIKELPRTLSLRMKVERLDKNVESQLQTSSFKLKLANGFRSSL